MNLQGTKTGLPIVKTFFALGTANSIKIFDRKKEAVLEKAAGRVLEIDDRMSAFKPDSDICRLSKNSGRSCQPMHHDTFLLLEKAVAFGDLSGGTFDITVRPLVKLWGINKKGDFVPSDSEIENALRLVDYRAVRLEPGSISAFLERPGQALDLGGIAKGFAADEVRRILLENGVHSALVNLGGNVAAVGGRPDGQPWQIGIQNPLAPTGQFLGVLSAVDKTIVTSGSNERFFIKDGVRYHHILDPRTGKPAQGSLLSVTAVCDCSADADALTTALFILGPEKSAPLLKRFKAEALFVADDLTVTVTPGLLSQFRISEEYARIAVL